MKPGATVVVAAAGSGKTDYLVRRAWSLQPAPVVILTYTESNEAEIFQRFIELYGFVPKSVTIQTWFSFLLWHGVRPFQEGIINFDVAGMILVSTRSGRKYVTASGNPVYWGEDRLDRYYANSDRQIYSDKLAKLVIRCNENSSGATFDRIRRIFDYIFVDEVQDLAGYDLDVLAGLIKIGVSVTAVGDPRQVIYLTHREARHAKFSRGGFVEFFRTMLGRKTIVDIDEATLGVSHRCSEQICLLASKVYPDLPPTSACTCCSSKSSSGCGLMLVSPVDAEQYLIETGAMQLRHSAANKDVIGSFDAMNFGQSKGRSFDRVLIAPTEDMASWLLDSKQELAAETRARLYVAITRARVSVAFLWKTQSSEIPAGFRRYRGGA